MRHDPSLVEIGGAEVLKSLIRVARQISRRLYMRVLLYAALNVVAVLAAALLEPLIPDGLGLTIGAGSVDTILQIIASSMLAVTTFSLTIMTSAFGRASGQWTPRSHLMLREDTVTHSVLATFVGAYLFALVAIILRATDFYGAREIVVLFIVTLAVVAAIIVSIIRWIVHLEGLGSLTETAARMERHAAATLGRAGDRPCNGGHPLDHPDLTIPGDAAVITAPGPGYVQQLYEDALQSAAEARDARIYVVAEVGSYVQKGDPLARVSGAGAVGEALRTAIREAIPVRDIRSFEQDPVFAVTVLSEVAVRALSPGVNDPGTATDILNRLSHVIPLAAPAGADRSGPVRCDRLWVPPVQPEALLHAAMDPVARCAGDAVEVHEAIQRARDDIARRAQPPLAQAARDCAARAMRRARAAISDRADRARLRACRKG